MLSLSSRVDGFRFRFPKEFIFEPLQEKYGKILNKYNGFISDPIEFLNETIKSVSVLGFNDATVLQQLQYNRQTPMKLKNDEMQYTANEVAYRSVVNPISLIDKTFVVTLRHTLGYLNYFMLFENFFYLYARETKSKSLEYDFTVDLLNKNGEICSRIVLSHPMIDGIENLNFDYTQPTSSNSEFKITFKFSNIDYEFIEISE